MSRNIAAGVFAAVLIAFCGTAATGRALAQTAAQAGTQDSGALPGATGTQAAPRRR